MTQWYYSDYERNRHGPVTARDLADLHHAGQLHADTLVWREGLAQWQPWRTLMAEALDEAAGREKPVVEAAPLSQGVNPYAVAEPRAEAASVQDAAAASSTLSSGVDQYAVAEPASPYAPPRARLADGDGYVGGGEVVYAGFWKRVAASFIDTVVLMFVIGILAGVLGAMGLFSGFMDTTGPNMGVIGIFYLLEIVLMAVYFAAMHASGRQATLGKMAVGIKVTDDDGHRISFGRGIGRYFAYLLSSVVFCIGYLMAAFTDRKRALHDMIRSTLVVDQHAYTEQPQLQRHELGTVTIVVLALLALVVVGYFSLLMLVFAGLAAAGG